MSQMIFGKLVQPLQATDDKAFVEYDQPSGSVEPGHYRRNRFFANTFGLQAKEGAPCFVVDGHVIAVRLEGSVCP